MKVHLSEPLLDETEGGIPKRELKVEGKAARTIEIYVGIPKRELKAA